MDRFFLKEETDSTQNDARQRIEAGEAQHGDICCALYQSAGRGRIAGRNWEGEKEAALMCTFILEKKKAPLSPPLSLILGLAAALSIEEDYNLTPKIKWPNDIYLEEKKCGGILCESAGRFWLCGMGINLNQNTFPKELEEKAISLKQILKRPVNRDSFLTTLRNHINQLLTLSPEKTLSKIEERLLWKGENKTLLLGDPANKEEVQGRIEGLHHDGALLFGSAKGLEKIYSAEFTG
ncbi:MAG: biotin--[acetyl-CoA-carboxylase] ligase [Spirochaetales bacterium]|nr:biotin--[acetyl-CoA-carboxylase] ligase [Spirochaetales bacterium]